MILYKDSVIQYSPEVPSIYHKLRSLNINDMISKHKLRSLGFVLILRAKLLEIHIPL